MIQRLYVHNFRCLENFELGLRGRRSVLLIGNNGSGKTTVGMALEVLQKIGRGTNRVEELVKPKDFSRGRADVPMRFELEVELGNKVYSYIVAFDFPAGFKELRVSEEHLSIDGHAIYTRELAQVHLSRTGTDREATFRIDWHLVALPIVQDQSGADLLARFKSWLAGMLILRPIPSLISGESNKETLRPSPQVEDFAAWFSGFFADKLATYSRFEDYLKQLMPDLKDVQNPLVGTDARSLVVQFSNNGAGFKLPFAELSDGEKCFMICGLVLAVKSAFEDVICFWDEPDNYLALSEVGHFVLALRSEFEAGGQLIVTSHNPEAIDRFSDENTIVLHRRSHLEPTLARPLSELQISGDLISALIRGDVEP